MNIYQNRKAHMKQLVNNNDLRATLYAWVGAFFRASGRKVTVVIAFALLLALDLLTGVRKSYKLGIPITRKKAIKGILDKLSLICIPLAITLMWLGIDMNMSWIVITSLALMNVFLTYGIISNIYTAYTWEDAEQRDGMTVFIKRLLTYVSRVGESLVDMDHNNHQNTTPQKNEEKKKQEQPTSP